jgi:hypothetical protein
VIFNSDSLARIFSFFYTGSTDLAGTTAPGFSTDYTLTVVATIMAADGITQTTYSASADHVLTIKNPCVDENYFTVTSPVSLQNFFYTLYDNTGNTWVNNAF